MQISLFTATAFCLAAPIFAQTESREEMDLFLQNFPELRACTLEQQKEAFSFYEKAQEIQELIREAGRAIERSDSQTAIEKMDEAGRTFQSLSD